MAEDENILHIPTKIHLGDALNGLLFLAGIVAFGFVFSSWMTTGDPLGFLKRMRWSNAAYNNGYQSFAGEEVPEPPIAIPPFAPYGARGYNLDPDYYNYGRRISPQAQARRRAARAQGVPTGVPSYRGLASYQVPSDYNYYDYRAFQRSQVPYPPMYENEYQANEGYLPGEITNAEQFTIERDKHGRITGGHTKRHVTEH